jgi:ATPase subunit of ABC transporter with duplicated ATPase domains
MNSGSLLKVESLSYSTHGGRPLVRGLSFTLNRGEFLAVVGPNGIGKSTLLQIVLGEAAPDAGRVQLNTRSFSFLSQLHNREFHIPLRLLDVIQLQLSMPAKIEEVTGLGLLTTNELDLAWNTASGGERQKTLLTGLLLKKPDLLLLDEPMNHLDSWTRKTLMDYLSLITKSKQCAVLMVCHEKALEEMLLGELKTLVLSRHSPK